MRAAVVEILFVAPEITPYSRSGSVGDVCAALPKALRGLGHRVLVVSPLFGGIDPVANGFARRLSPLGVEVGGERVDCRVFDGRTTGGVDLAFVAHEAFAESTERELDPATRARAAAILGGAAVELARTREPAAEVIHAHGAFAAPALVAAAKTLPAAGRVLSLHGAPLAAIDTMLSAAQRVIADSQVEAAALAASGAQKLGEGRVFGIADGLDAARWNPLTDSHLPARFDPVNLEGKARCKDQLQLDTGLPVRPEAPLLAVVLHGANGMAGGAARLADALGDAVRNDVQFVVVGGLGDATLAALHEKAPERIALTPALDEKLLHRVLGASDLVMFPAPPRHEGNAVAAAMRYGALPIAQQAGAAADTLVDCDAKLETGTGFVIERADANELAETIARAVAAHAQGERFVALRRRVMRLDLSWDRSARRYEHVYRGVLARAD